MSPTRIHLVAAMTPERVIGFEGGMPWHLPRDLAHFKAVTLGHPVVMGRKTFESILTSLGRPLPGRQNIVISRGQPEVPEGVWVYSSLEQALDRLSEDQVPVVDIIGGGQIYDLALPQADRLYLTLIDAQIEGDTWFPNVDMSKWHVIDTQTHPQDEHNSHSMTFVTLDRSGPQAPDKLSA